MRPKILSLKNFVLLALAAGIAFGLFSWLNSGGHLPWEGKADTAGKIAFVSDRDGGRRHIFLMDGATGAGVVRLSSDAKADDREPAFSPDGAEIAFVADRHGVVPQLYQMNAEPGARLLQRTRTSGTKEQPQHLGRKGIFFLDAGKIASISADSSDADAIFPTVEDIKDKYGSLFDQGGIDSFSVSPDGEKVAAVLGVEGGEAVLVFFHDSGDLVALGVARKAFCGFAADGSLLAAFFGGDEKDAPRAEPIGLYVPSSMSPEQKATYRVPALTGAMVLSQDTPEGADAGLLRIPPTSGGVNRIVRFDDQLKAQAGAPLPPEVMPDSFAPSPDGKRAAIALSEGVAAGVYVIPLTQDGTGGQVYNKPSEHPAWSPDGSRLAFASEGDIYVAPTDGSAAPTNLTKGQGKNSRPVWSPQKPKAGGAGEGAAMAAAAKQ
jgi:dipeptidyl aminopeptidase/acylaminoacyl peptidase